MTKLRRDELLQATAPQRAHLTRDELYQALALRSPDLARGKSRARKELLLEEHAKLDAALVAAPDSGTRTATPETAPPAAADDEVDGDEVDTSRERTRPLSLRQATALMELAQRTAPWLQAALTTPQDKVGHHPDMRVWVLLRSVQTGWPGAHSIRDKRNLSRQLRELYNLLRRKPFEAK